jgi:hypothetical protein
MRQTSHRVRLLSALSLLCAALALVPVRGYAQDIDFGQIDEFESLGTGTLHVGMPPKTIVDDGERHTVVLTIWEADAETKVYWKPLNGDAPRTTIIPGKAVQAFQTAGDFRLEALGDPYHRVKYGYLLLRLKK